MVKNFLLTSYAKKHTAQGNLVAMVSLKKEHSNPIAFTTAICEEIALTFGLEKSNWSFPKLINQLAKSSADRSSTLILDSYENAESNEVNSLVTQLLSNSEFKLKIIISARTRPCFITSSIALSTEVSQLNSEQLSFSLAETQKYLSSNLDPSLYSDDISKKIYNRTEGWPIAVELCALLIKKYSSIDFLENYSGKDSYLSSYFYEQVMQDLGDEQRALCGAMACFNQFSISLANCVLEINNAEELIEGLHKQGKFIEPLDRTGAEYRFHPMFREYLCSTQWSPSHLQRKKLFGKASKWAIEQESIILSIDFAIAAEDFSSATELLSESAKYLIRDQGNLHKLIEWCEKIPLCDDIKSIELHFWLAWAFTFSWLLPQAKSSIRELSQLIGRTEKLSRDQKQFYLSRISSAYLALTIFNDDGGKVYRQSGKWLRNYANVADPFDISVAEGARFLSSRLLLKKEDAKDAITNAKRNIAPTGSLYGMMWINALEGLYEMEFGSYKVASQLLDHAYNTLTEKENNTSPIKSTIALLLAKVVYEIGDLNRAQNLLEVGLTYLERHGLIESAAAGISLSVKLALPHSLAKARYSLSKLEYLSARYSGRLKYVIQKAQIQILLQEGRLDEAIKQASWAGIEFKNGEYTLQETTLPLVNFEKEILAIELLCRMEKYSVATLRLENLLATQSCYSRPIIHVNLLSLYSFVLFKTEHKLAACRQFTKAMKICTANGFFQVLVDRRIFIEPILIEVILTRQHAGLLEEDSIALRLERALGLSVHDADLSVTEKPVLSGREQEILLLLPSSMSVQEIADYLFLTKATIKTHINNIYKKLGVNNRTGAIETSRRYDLLSSN